MTRALLLLAVLILLTACAPTTVIPPPGVAAEAPTSTPSLRPRDIDISDVDPCELLTPAQRDDLRLEAEPLLDSDDSGLWGRAGSCSFNRFDTEPSVGVRVTLAVDFGVERFDRSDLVTPVSPIQIAGYPAVLSPPPPFLPDSCVVAIDTSPGQMIGVRLSDGAGDPAIPVDDLCLDVQRFAEAVVATLLTRY